MYKMMMASIAVLTILVSLAMAEESSTNMAYPSVAQAQKMFAMNGTDAFEQISGSDAFDPFVFVFNTSGLITMARPISQSWRRRVHLTHIRQDTRMKACWST